MACFNERGDRYQWKTSLHYRIDISIEKKYVNFIDQDNDNLKGRLEN